MSAMLTFRPIVLIAFLGVFPFGHSALAQTPYCGLFKVEDTLYFSPKTPVVPHSVAVAFLSSNEYILNANKGYLILKNNLNKDLLPDSLNICFIKIPVFLNDWKQLRHDSFMLNEMPYGTQKGYTRLENNKDITKLKTIGNVARGIGFGNNQDVAINSNLNLSIQGELENGYIISGVISDDNSPIQPEGSTQQIQDFDRVYIKINKDSSQLTAGDFLMQAPSSYFMKYSKRSRGLQLKVLNEKNGLKYGINSDLAFSRGRFSRNEIESEEGNRGPYRLTGAKGELFILLIAGTEKIYLDGKLLKRGLDRDYVIDYNAGELTFTANTVITEFSRIVAEFQYSDRNYARSVYTINSMLKTKENWNFQVALFSEQDHKNRPFQQGLDSINNLDPKQILSLSGDDKEKAVLLLAQETDFLTNRPVYTKDSVVGLGEIFVHTTQNDLEKYYLPVFSYVGKGNGDYDIIQSNINGRVYEYVGVNQGEYAAVQQLVAPESRQQLSLSMGKNLKNSAFKFEVALSRLDLNTFSTIDDSDDLGVAFNLIYKGKKLMSKNDSLKKPILLTYNWSTEVKNQNFNPIERYRNVEFNRIWQKGLLLSNGDIQNNHPELLSTLNINLNNQKNFRNNWRLSHFNQIGHFEGYNALMSIRLETKSINQFIELEAHSAQLNLDSALQNNQYQGGKYKIEKSFAHFVPFVETGWERSLFTFNNSNNLGSNSYAFWELAPGIKNNDTAQIKYQMLYRQRQDFRPQQEAMLSFSESKQWEAETQFSGKKRGSLTLKTVYRELNFSEIVNQKTDKTLQGQGQWRWNLWQKMLRSNTFYQLGTGREQRREFIYQEVAAGQGFYVWNDYDSNGVQNINEFETASDLDAFRANFIRLFIPIQGFISSKTLNFSQTLNIDLNHLAQKKKSAFFQILSHFSNLSGLRSEKKIIDEGFLNILNPFDFNFLDTSIINKLFSLRNTLSYNRSRSAVGFNYYYAINQSKNLLNNGFSSRDRRSHKLENRLNLFGFMSIVSHIRQEKHFYEPPLNKELSFDYILWGGEQKFTFQSTTLGTNSLTWTYFQSKNQEALGGQKARFLDLALSSRINLKDLVPGGGSINAEFALVDINYNGAVNSPLGYELLNGLQNGINYRWRANVQKTLRNDIQIILNYDGRKSKDINAFHQGNVVVRYLFN